MFNRHFQVKVVKDPKSRNDTTPTANAENSSEAIAIEIVQQATACVVVGYTICRSVNFVLGMVEHVVVTKL